MSVYLDYNATAKVRPEAAAAVAHALEMGGNPSSVHAAGRAARGLVETARAEVGRLVGAGAGAQIVFASGGTEADALAMGSAIADGAERILLGATEHDAVVETAKASGLPVETWPVDNRGVADLDWLGERLPGGPRALVCLMLANNETGVIQPVAEAAALTRAAGAWLHVDAVQAAGKVAVDIEALGAHTLAVSAHKLGGPQGVGALIAVADARLSPRQHGGGQEKGVRGGTQNTPGIAGFGAAASAALAELSDFARQSAWRDGLSARLAAEGATIVGEGAPRLPQTLCFAQRGFSSDLQVMGLDLAGVMVSAGAACSSGKVKASRVAEAMGLSDLAPCVVRVSGGWATTASDWTRCGEAWLDSLARHRARAGAPALA
ncbi:MAG: cysteine desulfurase family protein [Caulobacteraceae bacterium]